MGIPVKEIAFIFDIDGTIASMNYRRHLIEGEHQDWEEFYKQSLGDKPIEQTIKLAYWCKNENIPIFFCTGRQEAYRQTTIDWLAKQNLYTHDYSLLMRHELDKRKADEVKRDMLHIVRKQYNVLLALENEETITKMYRKEGILCILCGEIITDGEVL